MMSVPIAACNRIEIIVSVHACVSMRLNCLLFSSVMCCMFVHVLECMCQQCELCSDVYAHDSCHTILCSELSDMCYPNVR